MIVGDGVLQRRYVRCYNHREMERQQKHRKQVVKELEKEFASYPDNKATARWAMDLLASRRYKRYLAIDEQDRVQIDRETIQFASKYDGKWVLQTNNDSISVEDAAFG